MPRKQSEHDALPEPLWTEKQTARFLNHKTERKLQADRQKGVGVPFVRISPGCIRYVPAEVRQYLRENTYQSTSEYDAPRRKTRERREKAEEYARRNKRPGAQARPRKRNTADDREPADA